jgi:hypothetical protein
MKLIDVKAKIISSIISYCSENQELKSISINNRNQTHINDREYRLNTANLLSSILTVQAYFKELETFDISGNIAAMSTKSMKKELEDIFVNTKIQNYNINLAVQGTNFILKELTYTNFNKLPIIISHYKKSKSYSKTSNKRKAKEFDSIEKENNKQSKKVKKTYKDFTDLTYTESKLLIKQEEMYFTPDVKKIDMYYSNIFLVVWLVT